MTPTLYIAHRGESLDAPENTLASIDLAWQRGDDAVEFDVHVTADGRVVLCHDPDTARTGDRLLVIREHTLAELRQIDVGRWKGPQWIGQTIPTLDEVLSRTPTGKRLFVEIKPDAESAADTVANIIANPLWATADVSVISFHLNVLQRVKLHCPARKCFWLLEKSDQSNTAIDTAQAAGVEGVSLEDGPTITAALVRRLHDAGMEAYVWTVDDLARCRELAAMGFDGITSNRAAWIREQG